MVRRVKFKGGSELKKATIRSAVTPVRLFIPQFALAAVGRLCFGGGTANKDANTNSANGIRHRADGDGRRADEATGHSDSTDACLANIGARACAHRPIRPQWSLPPL